MGKEARGGRDGGGIEGERDSRNGRRCFFARGGAWAVAGPRGIEGKEQKPAIMHLLPRRRDNGGDTEQVGRSVAGIT